MLAVEGAKLALARAKRLDFLGIEHHLRQQRLAPPRQGADQAANAAFSRLPADADQALGCKPRARAGDRLRDVRRSGDRFGLGRTGSAH